MNTPLQLKDFSFDVPPEQIAQRPLANRDDARLLLWQDGKTSDRRITDLAELVPAGSLFIVNNSKVIASRIRFHLTTGGAAELLLLEPLRQNNHEEHWSALARPMRRIREGQLFDLGHGLTAKILNTKTASESSGPQPITVALSLAGSELIRWLDQHGEMPLPPYIERKNADHSLHEHDRSRYQTVYAATQGSVAAPTAGLHFTDEVLARLRDRGCEFASVTLHIGAGTFLPVKSTDISQHVMHTERFLVPTDTMTKINAAKSSGRSIIVVGTTALRSLEGLADIAKERRVGMETLTDQWLRTNIFIRPVFPTSEHRSWVASALMTNFHQPESTLYMLVCALVGYDQASQIYRHAIESGYRFFSYGDSSLLWLDSKDKN